MYVFEEINAIFAVNKKAEIDDKIISPVRNKITQTLDF